MQSKTIGVVYFTMLMILQWHLVVWNWTTCIHACTQSENPIYKAQLITPYYNTLVQLHVYLQCLYKIYDVHFLVILQQWLYC